MVLNKMNKTLLTQIQKNLYDVKTSVESAKENFEKNNIDVERFLKTIVLYKFKGQKFKGQVMLM